MRKMLKISLLNLLDPIQRDASSGDGIDILTISNRGKNEESLKV